MHLLDKCKVLFAFLLFSCFVFGNDHCVDPVRYVQESKEKIWMQLVDLIQAEDCTDDEKSVELVSYTGGKVAVSQSFARKLLSLDSFGHVQRTDESFRGHHPVVRLKDLFFKSDVCLPPLDPMMETAVFFFHGLLFQEGVVPGDFVFIKNVQICRFPAGPWEAKEIQQVVLEQEDRFVQENPSLRASLTYELQNHLVQISQAIDGMRSDSFISLVDEGKRSLDEIEALDFQKHVITDMLLHPGDHKAENFIITAHSPQNHMVNVDNDGVFYHTKVIKTEGGNFSEIQPFGGCKNMLFVLKPLMDKPIDHSLKQKIEELDIDAFLRRWILLLEGINQQIIKTFHAEPSFAKRYEKNFLPLKFPEKAVARIRAELNSIKNFFKTHPSCTCTDLFQLLKADVADYYSWMLRQHKTYAKSLGKLYGNERPFAQGRVPGARIGAKPLKGRWIFQAIERYKKSRTTDLKDSIQELNIPFQDYAAVDAPFLGSANLQEILLKNSDDPLWREWVSGDVLQALCYNRLPEKMKTQYPYNFLQNKILLLLKNDQKTAEKIVFEELKEFSSSQKTFEDFVYFLFDEKSDEDCLPEGIKKCAASLQPKEKTVCK